MFSWSASEWFKRAPVAGLAMLAVVALSAPSQADVTSNAVAIASARATKAVGIGSRLLHWRLRLRNERHGARDETARTR